jgi:phage antirepressor YoqD-like protein
MTYVHLQSKQQQRPSYAPARPQAGTGVWNPAAPNNKEPQRSKTTLNPIAETGFDNLTVPQIGPAGKAPVTMTSLELVEFINAFRRTQAEAAGQAFPSPGFAELRHSDFLAKVPQVLGKEAERNFSFTYQSAESSRSYPCYRFPKREACLMAMSYSYELQAAVYDRMTALEEQTRGHALSREEILSQAIQIALGDNAALRQQLALDAPKVEFAEAVSVAEGGVSVNRFSKILQQHGIKDMGPHRLYKELRAAGFLISKRGKNWNVPKQKYVERGWFRIIEYLTPDDDCIQYITPDFAITGAGQQALLAYFMDKYGINRQLSLFDRHARKR